MAWRPEPFLFLAKCSWLHLGLLETDSAKNKVGPRFCFCYFFFNTWSLLRNLEVVSGGGWQAGFSPELSNTTLLKV